MSTIPEEQAFGPVFYYMAAVSRNKSNHGKRNFQMCDELAIFDPYFLQNRYAIRITNLESC